MNTTKLSKGPENMYIVDFFNIFSDYREIKYKKENIDFHTVKHHNKEKDTQDFFDIFFSRYIEYVNINKNSRFIFIMKKLHGYEQVLMNILIKHSIFNVKFLIIEDKYNDDFLDKNKDYFLCQYIFYTMQKRFNCVLISNDKYRDRSAYVRLFTFDMSLTAMQWSRSQQKIEKHTLSFHLNKNLSNNLVYQRCTRCTIPKNKLDTIL